MPKFALKNSPVYDVIIYLQKKNATMRAMLFVYWITTSEYPCYHVAVVI